MTTGEVIRYIREKLAMSKRAFGTACGVSGSYIQQLEEGERQASVETAENIKSLANAKKIKVNIEYGKSFKRLYIP